MSSRGVFQSRQSGNGRLPCRLGGREGADLGQLIKTPSLAFQEPPSFSTVPIIISITLFVECVAERLYVMNDCIYFKMMLIQLALAYVPHPFIPQYEYAPPNCLTCFRECFGVVMELWSKFIWSFLAGSLPTTSGILFSHETRNHQYSELEWLADEWQKNKNSRYQC